MPVHGRVDQDHSCCRSEHDADAAEKMPAAGGQAAKKYFCPMCAGVESDKPGDCPKCGMALERNPTWSPAARIYTCPMHPEIKHDAPGDCPICGMALEPKTVSAGDAEDNSELRDMSHRLLICAALTVPVFILAMSHLVPNAPAWVDGGTSRSLQFALSTPVVL